MTETQAPYVAPRVRNLQRELIHAEEALKTLDRERTECQARITSIKAQIDAEEKRG